MTSSPVYRNQASLKEVDDMIQKAAISATNADLSGKAWQQASLPTRYGGLGLRRVEALALPCYLSSMHSSLDLMNQILRNAAAMSQTQLPKQLVDATHDFNVSFPNISPPEGEAAANQRAWDEAVSKEEFNNLINSANQIHSARLLAAASPHTGAWLQALPIPELGLHIENEVVRTAVA